MQRIWPLVTLTACGWFDPAAPPSCEGGGSFVGCADLDGAPQDCPGDTFSTAESHVAWSGPGGFNDDDGFTLVLGPGDRDVVLAVHLPAGLPGTGPVDLSTAELGAWQVADPSAPVAHTEPCGPNLRIDSYTPGPDGRVAGWGFFYLDADGEDCDPWPPTVQIGAEFDVPYQPASCALPEDVDPDTDSDSDTEADSDTGGCPTADTVGCIDPNHDCPSENGPFDTSMGSIFWDGDATATASTVRVTEPGTPRSLTMTVPGTLTAGTYLQGDMASVGLTGDDGIERSNICGGTLIIDDSSTATALTGRWFWYMYAPAGTCDPFDAALQTSGQFAAVPVCAE